MSSSMLKFLFKKWFENIVYLGVLSFMIWGASYIILTYPIVALFTACSAVALTLIDFYAGKYDTERK